MNLAPLRVALLVVPPVRELDLVGIVDVFVTANGFLPPERQYQLELVTSSVQPDIEGMCGLRFAGARHYSTLEGGNFQRVFTREIGKSPALYVEGPPGGGATQAGELHAKP